jgi:hypothetical protein
MMTVATKSILLFAFGVLVNSQLWAQSYPDASNTGWQHTGVTLTPYTGPTTITTNNTVIDGKNITSCLTIRGDNVTIRRSKAVANCIYTIALEGAENLLIEDTEISCEGNYVGVAAISGVANYTARRVYARNCENPLFPSSGSTVENSYIDELCPKSSDPHSDGLQMFGGVSNITIRNNRIYARCSTGGSGLNAAITGGNNISNLLVENNLLAGGGYTLGLSESGSFGPNVRVRNNKFSTIFHPKSGFYGPINFASTPSEHCGSVWYDGSDAGKIIAYSSNKACADGDSLRAPQNLRFP